MSLAVIKEKILAEGEKEKEKILAYAKEEAKEILKGAEEKTNKMQQEFEKEMTRLKAEVKEQLRIQAQAKAKSNILQKKQEMIDEVFKLALKKMLAQSQVERRELMENFLESARKELGAELVVTPVKKDREIIAGILKKHPSLSLDAQEALGQAGFIIASPKVEQDYTFDNIVKEKREELESEVAKILFK